MLLFATLYDRGLEFLYLILKEIKYYFNVFFIFWLFCFPQLNVRSQFLGVNFFTFFFLSFFFFEIDITILRLVIILNTSTKSRFQHFFASRECTLRFISFITAINFSKFQWRLRVQNLWIKIFFITLINNHI